MNDQGMMDRWRLILGDFAEEALPLDPSDREMDNALAFLYNREYGSEQGVRQDTGGSRGGHGASVLSVPAWMNKVKRLFPKRTVEIMQKQALNKYHMTEMLTDESVLREMEPNLDLLKNILTFRHLMPQNVKKMAYEIVEKVVRELSRKLEVHVQRVFHGRKLPNTTGYKVFRNFDVKRTIAKNLRHYDPERKTIVVERLYFNQNVKRHNPWNVVILVDESGSMMDSVIYTAVMASIFAKMPVLSVKLVIFDTAVVDLSDHLDDPVDILMKVQLGGGTDIYKAMEYGKKLITAPQKTIVVLVSDLYDGNDYRLMYRSCRDMIEAGSRVFVLPALDYAAEPCYDGRAAKQFSAMGAHVAAITPEELAEWIGKIIT